MRRGRKRRIDYINAFRLFAALFIFVSSYYFHVDLLLSIRLACHIVMLFSSHNVLFIIYSAILIKTIFF